MKKWKMSFQQNNRFYIKIVCTLIAFSCLPILVLWSIQRTMTVQEMKQQMFGQASMGLRDFDERLNGLMEQQMAALHSLSDDVDILHFMTDYERYVYKVNYKLYLMFGNQQNEVSVYIIPTGAQEATGTSSLPYDYQYPHNENDWGIFRKTNQTTDIVFHINARRDASQSVPLFSLGRAIYQDQTKVGYIIIDIGRDAIERILPENNWDTDANTYLSDEWRFVCFNSIDAKAEGRGQLPEYIPSHSFSTMETKEGEQNRKIGLVQTKNEKTGLIITQEIPLFRMDNSLRAINLSAQRTILICLFISVIIAIAAGNAITKPLQMLMQEIRKVKSGDFHAKIENNRRDEFGELMDSFNEMTEQIQRYIRLVEEKQSSLRIAEMKNLQAQIQPHFLYNTLDLIKWNIKLNEPEKAVSIIANLGKLLHTIMNLEDFTKVRNELDLVNSYLQIQAVHYNDQLTIRWDIDPALLDEKIPKLILQPIAENSVVHGLDLERDDNQIAISAKYRGDYMVFSICDNGKGIPSEQIDEIFKKENTDESSIGMYNVALRLKLFGDENCGVLVQNTMTGTVVQLICKRMQEE